MTEFDDRLVRCFSSVFPTLTEEEIRVADLEQMADADSLAGVTLVALIEQEFGVEIDLEVWTELRSFRAIEQYLHDQRMPRLVSRNR